MITIKKKLYYLFTIIQVLLLIASYVFNNLIPKKMGLYRHVLHKNSVFERTYPIQTLKIIFALSLILISVILIYLLLKKIGLNKELRSNYIYFAIELCIISVLILIFVFLGPAIFKGYYYISLAILSIYALEIIKTLIIIK